MFSAAVLSLVAATSCQREDPARVGEDYLNYIEQGEYEKAYGLVDKISKQYVSKEQFVQYWKDSEGKYGKPYKHEIMETGKDSGIVTIDYYWYYKQPESGQARFFEDKRFYRLKLTRNFQGWRVKFLKYSVRYEKRK